MRQALPRLLGGASLAIAASALLAWPLFELFRIAAEHLGEGRFGSPVMVEAVGNTVLDGVMVSLLALGLGASGAYLTERTGVVGRRWLRLGILLPVLIPPFVSALSFIRAYGPSGLAEDLAGIRLPGLFGPAGVILVISLSAMPLAYLLTVAGLNISADRHLELAARASGATAAAVMATVTLPLVGPVVVGAAALLFVVGINAFGVPAFLGTPASFDTVTTLIYQDLALSARPESFSRAILLATGLILTALVFATVAESFLGHVGRGPRTAEVPGLVRRPGRAVRLLAIVVWGLVVLATVVPLVALILVALTKGVGMAPAPTNWTLANFAEALRPRFLGALGRSALLALSAATVGTLLGGLVAWLRGRLGRLGGLVVLAGFAVPGSALAVAMLLSYGSVLRDTLLIILFAYVAKLWAVGHRSIAGSAANIPQDLLRAARSSGASAGDSLRTVIMPLLRPTLVAAWVLIFLIGFHELTMSSLLYGPGSDTLAVLILNLQQLGDVPVSSALAVILTVPLLLAAIPLLVIGRLPGRVMGTG